MFPTVVKRVPFMRPSALGVSEIFVRVKSRASLEESVPRNVQMYVVSPLKRSTGDGQGSVQLGDGVVWELLAEVSHGVEDGFELATKRCQLILGHRWDGGEDGSG